MSTSHWQIVNNNRHVVSNTPEELWANAVEYFKWNDEHPIITKRYNTSGKAAGSSFNVEQPRPYSVKALCLHCNISEEYISDLRSTKDKNSEYYHVMSKILYIIYTQNLEYAQTEIFNPILTAKVLNIERKDEDEGGGTIKVEVISNTLDGKRIPELSNTENEILEKLELELSLKEKSKE